MKRMHIGMPKVWALARSMKDGAVPGPMQDNEEKP